MAPLGWVCREDEIRKTTAAPLSILKWTEHKKGRERPLDCKLIAQYDFVLVSAQACSLPACCAALQCGALHSFTRVMRVLCPSTGSGAASLGARQSARIPAPVDWYCRAGHAAAGLAAPHAEPHLLVSLSRKQAGRQPEGLAVWVCGAALI